VLFQGGPIKYISAWRSLLDILEIIYQYYSKKQVSMAERSKSSTVFGRSNIGIAGSNPARGMDVCLRLSVLCCPV
jgi:hypothetical protein